MIEKLLEYNVTLNDLHDKVQELIDEVNGLLTCWELQGGNNKKIQELIGLWSKRLDKLEKQHKEHKHKYSKEKSTLSTDGKGNYATNTMDETSTPITAKKEPVEEL